MGAGKTAEWEGKAEETQTCVQTYEVLGYLAVEQQVTASRPFATFAHSWCDPRLRKMLTLTEPPPVSFYAFISKYNPFVTTEYYNTNNF